MPSAKLSYQEIVFLGPAWGCSDNGTEPHSLFMLNVCMSPAAGHLPPHLYHSPAGEFSQSQGPVSFFVCLFPLLTLSHSSCGRAVPCCRQWVSGMVQYRLLVAVLGDLWTFVDSCHPLSHFLVKQHRALSPI